MLNVWLFIRDLSDYYSYLDDVFDNFYTITTDLPDCTQAVFQGDYESTSQLTIVHVVADYTEVFTSIDDLV